MYYLFRDWGEPSLFILLRPFTHFVSMAGQHRIVQLDKKEFARKLSIAIVVLLRSFLTS